MSRNTLSGAGVVAVLSFATAVFAQNAGALQNNDRIGTSTATTQTQSAVGVNKASKAGSLIGMDVRNPQGEKLGDIKDLVVDLPSGKISYAVLGVGGFLGIGERDIAVPPSAFTVAPDENNLVLNADKTKIQNAPALTRNNWPDVKSPTSNEFATYWTAGNTALGAPATTQSGTGAVSGLAHNTFRGRITAVDPQTNMLTVQGRDGTTQQFKVGTHANLALHHNGTGRLVDLKVGNGVVVGYTDENGAHVAQTITRSDMPDNKE
jgi:sporulation protein YlmC with PRC-barrel domain